MVALFADLEICVCLEALLAAAVFLRSLSNESA